MNNKRKLKKFNKNRVYRKRRRRIRPGLKESVYRTDIRLTTYSYNLGTATGFPLLLRLGAFFAENVRLQQCCTLFQQYCLEKIRVSVIPEIYQGSTPFLLYMLCSTDRNIDTTSELILSKGMRCSNTRPFTKTIRTSGRQNDFNYWFDCLSVNEADKRPTVQLAFTPDAYGRVPTGSYVITIIASFKFRYPQSVVPPTASSGKGIGGSTMNINGKDIRKEEDKNKEEEKEERKIEEKRDIKEENEIGKEDVWELTGSDDEKEWENEELKKENDKLKLEIQRLKMLKINDKK